MGTSLIAGCATSVSAPQATSTFGPDAAEATVHPNPTPSPTIEPGLTPTGPTQTARVVRIVDGDTIVVSMNGKNFKLRYIGMDTPEDVDPNSPVEPMGREAAAANQKLVAGRTVVLEKDVSETDRYGRLLRYVWLHQGSTWTLVNLELVRLGFASAVSYPPDVKYDEVFAPAEAGAQTSLVGLWAPDATAAPTVAPKPTPKPTPRPTPKPTKVASRCHPSYDPCLPIVGDLDCPDVRAMGLSPVHVIGPDDYRLDRDHDGLGCE
jgi:micrococcal nuclease